MPYPSQIDHEKIIETARLMIEAEGVDQLSLNKVAAALGVKTPSLYRYFNSKTALLRAVNEATLFALFRAIEPALETPGDMRARMIAVVTLFRRFAHANPVTYGMAFTNTIAELQPDTQELMGSVLAFQGAMSVFAGEAQSLAALRGLLALIHGWIMLELAGQFRRGGDLDAAFLQSVSAYFDGWARHNPTSG